MDYPDSGLKSEQLTGPGQDIGRQVELIYKLYTIKYNQLYTTKYNEMIYKLYTIKYIPDDFFSRSH